PIVNYIMNQPMNPVVNQPLRPQNADIHVDFNNLTANQKYEDLTKGANPFAKVQRTRNQEILPFQTIIFSGSSF
ncbi:18793_t:CDS:1, partial [Dentiscutata erythropus]